MQIFTLGTSTRTWEEFLAVLRAHRIELVADVRAFPRSQRHPDFSGEAMAHGLLAMGIRYRWLGRTLGGYRKGGYDRYLGTDTYLTGILELEALGRILRSACVCSERNPTDCHRRFIAGTLHARGWGVIHLIDEEFTVPHEALMGREGLAKNGKQEYV